MRAWINNIPQTNAGNNLFTDMYYMLNILFEFTFYQIGIMRIKYQIVRV